jgi:enoyl-CoA hydratase/carnithine racemase
VTEHIKVERDGAVLVISLNRPEKKNAITNAMYLALSAALEEAASDRAVRVVLIRAEGDVFSAGNDIADFAAAAMGGGGRENVGAFGFLRALAEADKPIVGAVRGLAVGIGTTMLLHCDLVFVAEDARLSTPFVDLALTPEAASSLLLPLRIGHPRAFAMFALGEQVDGRTAATLGLANAALPASEVDARALAAAQALATRPIGALIRTKRLMRDAEQLWSIMETEGRAFWERIQTPEAMEAFTAFMERRPADFSRID